MQQHLAAVVPIPRLGAGPAAVGANLAAPIQAGGDFKAVIPLRLWDERYIRYIRHTAVFAAVCRALIRYIIRYIAGAIRYIGMVCSARVRAVALVLIGIRYIFAVEMARVFVTCSVCSGCSACVRWRGRKVSLPSVIEAFAGVAFAGCLAG